MRTASPCWRPRTPSGPCLNGHYKEKEASTIPIPNIRYAVFESMMRCIYTGACPCQTHVQGFC